MAAVQIHWTAIDTPLGEGMLAVSRSGVCRIGLPGVSVSDQVEQLNSSYPDVELVEDTGAAQDAAAQLEEYWTGAREDFSAVVDLVGTSFQRSVWEYLRQIPYGHTVTYAQVAEGVGSPRAFQAVGRAVGANPVPLIVPCHRVIGSDGSLTGFAAGVDTKRWLLKHEGSLTESPE